MLVHFILWLSLFFFSSEAFAAKLHIIHTNDLHSYLESHVDGRGGYAKLKTKIMELKRWGEAQGAQTLILDAGDWGEGTSFYLVQEGVPSLRAMEMLGIEVSIIGNHDYMFGGLRLADQLQMANISTKILSANLISTPAMKLGPWIKATTDVTKGPLSIRIIGLSTNEAHYQYPLKPGHIMDPIDVGRAYDKVLNQGMPDLVIALTHLGYKKDQELAQKTSNIDVIVGGHSHTRLDEILWATNKKDRQIPIVQTGAHGLGVGSLLLDITKKKVRTISYQVHDVSQVTLEDGELKNFVQTLIERRADEFEIRFGRKWDEVIATSDIPLSGYQNGRRELTTSCWGEHMAKMVSEATKADIGFHICAFEGMNIEKGNITFGSIVDNFPHVRKVGDPGWELVRFHVNGFLLNNIRRFIKSRDNDLGINFWPADMNLHPLKVYKLAMPREIFDALKASLPKYLFTLVPTYEKTGIYYWPIMEDYLKKNSPLHCLEK
ncbi:MAG: bifunctional metallophosphatase/5'-nucleotidase [Bacteriovoracaceae bacterium]